jgi:hypothetical protein
MEEANLAGRQGVTRVASLYDSPHSQMPWGVRVRLFALRQFRKRRTARVQLHVADDVEPRHGDISTRLAIESTPGVVLTAPSMPRLRTGPNRHPATVLHHLSDPLDVQERSWPEPFNDLLRSQVGMPPPQRADANPRSRSTVERPTDLLLQRTALCGGCTKFPDEPVSPRRSQWILGAHLRDQLIRCDFWVLFPNGMGSRPRLLAGEMPRRMM